MTDTVQVKRVFEVARELRVSTPTIIEYLASCGFDLRRQQMQPITEEMWVALLFKFDKFAFQKYILEHGLDDNDLQALNSRLPRSMRAEPKTERKIVEPKPREPVAPRPVSAYQSSARRGRPPIEFKPPERKSDTVFKVYFKPKPKEPPVVIPVETPVQYAVDSPPVHLMFLDFEIIRLILAMPTESRLNLLNSLR
jgi:hypothetical protein